MKPESRDYKNMHVSYVRECFQDLRGLIFEPCKSELAALLAKQMA